MTAIQSKDGQGTWLRSIDYIIFLLSCLALLYFIFEEEIRKLIGQNASKDLLVAEQAEIIHKLEPLSVLGERTAHVVHSFKNNMNQLTVAMFLLERKQDIPGAIDRLNVYTKAMEDRIGNILMVSQAGHKQEIETFDLNRLLDGINFIYLEESTFIKHARTEMDLPDQAIMVTTSRWAVILMMENLFKNAIEAIAERGHFGTVRVTLTETCLCVANNGGAMPYCGSCTETSCLACTRYGKVGQTTKAKGSGHGLAQVFQAVRESGWDLRISTEGDWTSFNINLSPRGCDPSA